MLLAGIGSISYILFLYLSFFYNRPAITELQNVAQVERVRKEKSVCFFLVTSSENPQLSEKLKVNVGVYYASINLFPNSSM